MTEQAAIYARVSTEEQADPDKTSLAQQRERCLGYCQAMGWEVVEVYEDAGVSGTMEPRLRPALGRLLEDAEAHRFQHVVFLKVDRLARSLRGLLNLSHQLDGLGVGLASVVEQFDTGTPTGRLYFNLLGAFAEFESARINERMSSGRRGAVRQGRYLASTVPFGYSRENGILKEHPQQADVVRQMFHWAQLGLGVKAIASRLEERNVEPPNPSKRRSHWGWHFTTVYKILRSPRYIGLATYGGEPMRCPAVIDDETFNGVQTEFKRHKRDSLRNTKRIYLLQHLVYCRHCGGRYTGKTAGSRTVYQCRQRAVYGKKAGHEGIRWRWDGRELESAITEYVLRVFADPDYLIHEAKVYREEAEQRFSAYEQQREQLRNSLASLEQQEIMALEGWQKGFYRDEPQLQDQLGRLRNQQDKVRAELEVLVAQAPAELSKAEKMRLLADYAAQWPNILPALAGFGGLEILVDLNRQRRIKVHTGDKPTREGHRWEFIRFDEWWRDAIASLVDRIWVEDDGTLTVEGTIETTGGSVQIGVSDNTRIR